MGGQMNLHSYGLTSLYESIGDRVVYRNLVPADPRLPSLDDLRPRLGLQEAPIPRKAEPAYGHVLAEVLRSARKLDLPGTDVRRLVYIGDTWMNDGNAFRNLCAAGEWPGWAFIGRDEIQEPPQFQVEGSLFQANRWAALEDFLGLLGEKGFGLDEQTAVVIDVDKTFIGARGRNDKVIDAARVEAVQGTVADLLGPDFDQQAFQQAYNELNQVVYHPFTSDNQDYLAYICLMLGAGLFELQELRAEIRSGRMPKFAGFIQQVQSRRPELAASGLEPVHDDVWRCFQGGDPTPFKAFRYNEYLSTAARFGDLPGEPVEQILAQRIVITYEVRQAAAALQQRGALVLAVSDKPDEASLPSEEQARAGMKPLHRLATLAVGQTPQELPS
jgi:hypothetical protein